MNKTEEFKNINQLEEKYTELLWNIIKSKNFQDKLLNIEKSLKKNYNFIIKNWDDKNIVKVAVERLIRFMVYRLDKCIDIYPSPLSSDLAVEFDDVILNVDAKTINMITNAGDDNAIHFGRKQITFKNKGYGKIPYGKKEFYLSYEPLLPPLFNEKPVLTFFITVNYEDNHKDKFNIIHQSLTCVPHKIIADEKFNNDLIANFKTYEYVSDNNSYGSKYNSRKSKSPDWKGPYRITKRSTDIFLDLSLKNPTTNRKGVFWKLIGGKYKAVLRGGGGARIMKKRIKLRENNNGGEWLGVRYHYYKK